MVTWNSHVRFASTLVIDFNHARFIHKTTKKETNGEVRLFF
jgi:hypothetical protein